MTYYCDLMFTFTNGEAMGIFSSMVRQLEELNHVQTYTYTHILWHSEMGVTVIPQAKLRPPPSCSYFYLPSQYVPQSGKVQKKQSKCFLTSNICTLLSVLLQIQTIVKK